MIIIGHIVDVLNEQIFNGRIVIESGKIKTIEPCEGVGNDAAYILPGFVDSHIHIESTLMTPQTFASVAVRQGTVAVATDPHEITNVLGRKGIDFMLENASTSSVCFSFGIPSCVPSTPFETAGATITSVDVAELLPSKEFYGLAEMMNFPGVLANDAEVMKKIELTLAAGKVVDGHAPGVTGDAAANYVKAGITTDHELYDINHARERIALGQKVQIREGSAACNFNELAPLLADDSNKGKLMFCTDDIYPDELLKGHINTLVSRAIAQGYPLWNVLNAACVTPVRHYSLPTGLLQKGDRADFILVDNLSDFKVKATYIAGNCLYQAGTEMPKPEPQADCPNCFNAHPVQKDDLKVAAPKAGAKMRVIVAEDGSLYTRKMLLDPKVDAGCCVSDTDRDLLKIVILNRYAEAPCSIGFVHGFGLKRGALASTIAHDSHNIIAVGADDESLSRVINRLVEMTGGLCVTDGEPNGRIADLALPIAGLMSPLPAEEIALKYQQVKTLACELGCPFAAPFMTLAFMALPVIPELKITDKYLFDVEKFERTDLFV